MKATYLKSKALIFDEKIQKLEWIVMLRYIAPIIIWIVVVAAGLPHVFSSQNFLVFTPITIVFLLVNAGIDLYLRRIKSFSDSKKKEIDINHIILIQVLFDIILFTLLIYFDGGIESPLILMYLFVVLVVGFLAKRLYGYIAVGIMSILYTLVTLGEYVGFIEHMYVRGESTVYFQDFGLVISDLMYVVAMLFILMYFMHYLARESKQLEKELDKLLIENGRIKEQYEDITDNAFDLIQSIDIRGNFMYTNKIWREKLGYTKEEIQKITIFDIVAEKDILIYKKTLDLLKDTKNNQHFRISLLSKTGAPIVVDGSVSAKLDKKMQIVSTREVLRDVTKGAASEERINQKSQEIEALNQTMVGRELKMIELQEKIKKLEGEK